MKPSRPSLCIGLAVALLGCSSERPTRPGEVAKMPASNLGTEIVIAPATAVFAPADPNGVGRFDFSSSPLFQGGAVSDIQLYVVGPHSGSAPWLTGTLAAYSDLDSIWHEIPSAVPVPSSICQGSCYATNTRLLSEIGIHSIDHYFDAAGRVRARALGASTFEARLVEYADDYHFRVVRSERVPPFVQIGIGVERNAIYLYSSYLPQNGVPGPDSLISLDLMGARRWTIPAPRCTSCIATYGGGHYWQYDASAHQLSQLDTLGNVVAVVTATVDALENLAWGNGSLWYTAQDAGIPTLGFYEVDVESTIVCGVLVSARRFERQTYSMQVQDLLAVAVDSASVLLATNDFPSEVIRYSLSGNELDRTSVAFGTTAMALDEESLWVLHHGGTFYADTWATLLSRFTLK